MKRFFAGLANQGPNTAFHVSKIGSTATGVVMIMTASDLGPLSPLIIASGIYLIIWALVTEAAFVLRGFLARIGRKFADGGK